MRLCCLVVMMCAEAEAMCIVGNVHFDPESSLYPWSPKQRPVKESVWRQQPTVAISILRGMGG